MWRIPHSPGWLEVNLLISQLGSQRLLRSFTCRVMAEARALRCLQNLSQLCSQWLRIPQRVTWHTFTYSKYLCSLSAWPGFPDTQVGRSTWRYAASPCDPAHWPGLVSQAWVRPPATLLKSKGALFLTHPKASGLDLIENPSCPAIVTKTGSAKIITRSWTMSCTLSAETYVRYLFILEVVTGRKVKIPAPDWHHRWKQRIAFFS